ncbi:hypothetical protein [Arsenicibacter rosenii]|uniref:Uncharacterized protein n=1 Tax=Arsenicibacter rosenii TaxID=1750698 RepID=A0A1S2VFX0_9BACT|nr:hypothetical protein [Arsenicibacter rosenii]OIN56798.1 hypothetical protein BLX24_22750 [Arsenicibacter rosenii]
MTIQTYTDILITDFATELVNEAEHQKQADPDLQKSNLFIDVLFLMGEIAALERQARPHHEVYPVSRRLAGYLIRYLEMMSLTVNLHKTPAEIVSNFLKTGKLRPGEIGDSLKLLTSEAGYMMVEEDNDRFRSLNCITWHAIQACFTEFIHIYPEAE